MPVSETTASGIEIQKPSRWCKSKVKRVERFQRRARSKSLPRGQQSHKPVSDMISMPTQTQPTMDMAIIKLQRDHPDHVSLVELTAVYHNLLRQWAEL